MVCTFFGHRDCPDSVKPQLLEAIKKQIAQGTTQFYVGNHGSFDRMALSCLRSLKQEQAGFSYAVVLAYLPSDPTAYLPEETIFPEGIEFVPKRFAIGFRNRWMVAAADCVISYVTHSWGGAAKYAKRAERKGAIVINL